MLYGLVLFLPSLWLGSQEIVEITEKWHTAPGYKEGILIVTYQILKSTPTIPSFFKVRRGSEVSKASLEMSARLTLLLLPYFVLFADVPGEPGDGANQEQGTGGEQHTGSQINR